MTADFVIVCLGCTTNFHGNEAMSAAAVGVRSIAECMRIRRAAERRIASLRERRGRLDLVVVGGGYTQIETASQLALLLRRRTGLSWQRLRRVATVHVLEKLPRVLTMVPRAVADWAVDHIVDYGLRIRTEVSAARFVGPEAVRLTDGSTLESGLVIWTAGVTPGEACAAIDVDKRTQGRLAVDEFLRLGGRERTFAAGDVAGVVRPGEREPIRMAVQASLAGGCAAAENVLATIRCEPLETFDPFDRGYVVPLAQGFGVGEILGVEFHGRLPYYLHYLMSTYRSWSWPNRLAVLKDVLHVPSDGR